MSLLYPLIYSCLYVTVPTGSAPNVDYYALGELPFECNCGYLLRKVCA